MTSCDATALSPGYWYNHIQPGLAMQENITLILIQIEPTASCIGIKLISPYLLCTTFPSTLFLQSLEEIQSQYNHISVCVPYNISSCRVSSDSMKCASKNSDASLLSALEKYMLFKASCTKRHSFARCVETTS